MSPISSILHWRDVDILPSPNIWYYPQAYEVENLAQDAEGEIWRVLAGEFDWTGRDVLDVGCGDGFHLPRFAASARSVTGVEPHAPLVRSARDRISGLAGVRVLHGAAQRLPLPDASMDLVHARTAYFFGPGCDPGLREVDRVLRPGGAMIIVDLDVTHEPYGRWMRDDLPDYDPPAVDQFFAEQGFSCERVETEWRFDGAAACEAVLKIEFSPAVARKAVAEVLRRNTSGDEVTFPVGYRVLVRRKPTGLIVPGHSPGSSSGSISPRMP